MYQKGNEDTSIKFTQRRNEEDYDTEDSDSDEAEYNIKKKIHNLKTKMLKSQVKEAERLANKAMKQLAKHKFKEEQDHILREEFDQQLSSSMIQRKKVNIADLEDQYKWYKRKAMQQLKDEAKGKATKGAAAKPDADASAKPKATGTVDPDVSSDPFDMRYSAKDMDFETWKK